MEEHIASNEKIDIGSFIEDKLPEITINCLTNIKSMFVILQNSFFTVTNRDLVVLKCFISKNSNADITKFLPSIGRSLKEESNGKTAIFYSSIKNTTVQIRNNLKNKKRNINVESIATPIKYKEEIIGYIGLTALNNEIVNILGIFIECLSLYIENELEKVLIKEDLVKYLNLINIEANGQFIDNLSSREKLISKYMLMASSNNEIAEELCISESTVKTYIRRLYEKCGTNNRIDTSIAIICSSILEKL